VCVCVCVCVCVQGCAQVCVCECVCAFVCTHACVCIPYAYYLYPKTIEYTDMHTCTLTLPPTKTHIPYTHTAHIYCTHTLYTHTVHTYCTHIAPCEDICHLLHVVFSHEDTHTHPHTHTTHFVNAPLNCITTVSRKE
jgi:hypothetical protein